MTCAPFGPARYYCISKQNHNLKLELLVDWYASPILFSVAKQFRIRTGLLGLSKFPGFLIIQGLMPKHSILLQ